VLVDGDDIFSSVVVCVNVKRIAGCRYWAFVGEVWEQRSKVAEEVCREEDFLRCWKDGWKDCWKNCWKYCWRRTEWEGRFLSCFYYRCFDRKI